ncbi:MAG TPA: nuclear transport factor 2 family protein [Micropepsaceae bacterium]|jgi:ketosteroid isomerase-like protein|nr:nuclear transport factor 2 family protein [Micropepsaceae bacterium]
MIDSRDFARDWVEAWNSHDLTRILAHYDDDVVLVSPRAKSIIGAADGAVRGKAALRDYFATALKRMPDLTFSLDRVYSGVKSVVVEYHTKDGRHGAEFMDFGTSGHVTRVVAHYAG